MTHVSAAQPPADKPRPAPAPAVPAPAPLPTDALPPDKPKVPVDFPHPLITEILYAVPTGPDGDASGDGKRDAAGDEFVELINPHDRPINLRGYRITDRNEPGKGQLKFIFPAIELPPGGIVVCFNGHDQKWTGPVGDTKAAPPAGNDKFHSAMVFTMKAESEKVSWANSGDWCLLSDPAGNEVQCLWWGKFSEKKPEKGLVEEVPLVSKCSVQRTGPTPAGSFAAHTSEAEGPYSPGVFRVPGAPAPTMPAVPAAPPPTQTPPKTGG